MNKFRIGDKIIYGHHKGVIYSVHGKKRITYNTYQFIYSVRLNYDNYEFISDIDIVEDMLELDISYYRAERLRELGII